MDPRINVVTLGVSDMPRARRFYQALGWRASASSNESFTLFRSKGVLLALYGCDALAEDATVEARDPRGFRGVTLARNVASKELVAQALADAVAAGGTLVKPAQDVFWGGHSGYYADPDGHLWEVAWNPHWTLLPDGGIELSK